MTSKLLVKLDPKFTNWQDWSENLLVEISDKYHVVDQLKMHDSLEGFKVETLLKQPFRSSKGLKVFTYDEDTKLTSETYVKDDALEMTRYLKDNELYTLRVSAYEKQSKELFKLIYTSMAEEIVTTLSQKPRTVGTVTFKWEDINQATDGVKLWYFLKEQHRVMAQETENDLIQELQALRQTGKYSNIREFYRRFDHLVKLIDSKRTVERHLSNRDKIQYLRITLAINDHQSFEKEIWSSGLDDPNLAKYDTIRLQMLNLQDQREKSGDTSSSLTGPSVVSSPAAAKRQPTKLQHASPNVNESTEETVKAYRMELADLKNHVHQLRDNAQKKKGRDADPQSQKSERPTSAKSGSLPKEDTDLAVAVCSNCCMAGHKKPTCPVKDNICTECRGGHSTHLHQTAMAIAAEQSGKRSNHSQGRFQNKPLGKRAKNFMFKMTAPTRPNRPEPTLRYDEAGEITYFIEEGSAWGEPCYRPKVDWELVIYPHEGEIGVRHEAFVVPREWRPFMDLRAFYRWAKDSAVRDLFTDRQGVIGRLPSLEKIYAHSEHVINMEPLFHFLWEFWRNCYPAIPFGLYRPCDRALWDTYCERFKEGEGWAKPTVLKGFKPSDNANICKHYQERFLAHHLSFSRETELEAQWSDQRFNSCYINVSRSVGHSIPDGKNPALTKKALRHHLLQCRQPGTDIDMPVYMEAPISREHSMSRMMLFRHHSTRVADLCRGTTLPGNTPVYLLPLGVDKVKPDNGSGSDPSVLWCTLDYFQTILEPSFRWLVAFQRDLRATHPELCQHQDASMVEDAYMYDIPPEITLQNYLRDGYRPLATTTPAALCTTLPVVAPQRIIPVSVAQLPPTVNVAQTKSSVSSLTSRPSVDVSLVPASGSSASAALSPPPLETSQKQASHSSTDTVMALDPSPERVSQPHRSDDPRPVAELAPTPQASAPTPAPVLQTSADPSTIPAPQAPATIPLPSAAEPKDSRVGSKRRAPKSKPTPSSDYVTALTAEVDQMLGPEPTGVHPPSDPPTARLTPRQEVAKIIDDLLPSSPDDTGAPKAPDTSRSPHPLAQPPSDSGEDNLSYPPRSPASTKQNAKLSTPKRTRAAEDKEARPHTLAVPTPPNPDSEPPSKRQSSASSTTQNKSSKSKTSAASRSAGDQHDNPGCKPGGTGVSSHENTAVAFTPNPSAIIAPTGLPFNPFTLPPSGEKVNPSGSKSHGASATTPRARGVAAAPPSSLAPDSSVRTPRPRDANSAGKQTKKVNMFSSRVAPPRPDDDIVLDSAAAASIETNPAAVRPYTALQPCNIAMEGVTGDSIPVSLQADVPGIGHTLVVPQAAGNILSVHELVKQGHQVLFTRNPQTGDPVSVIQTASGREIVGSSNEDNHFVLSRAQLDWLRTESAKVYSMLTANKSQAEPTAMPAIPVLAPPSNSRARPRQRRSVGSNPANAASEGYTEDEIARAKQVLVFQVRMF